MKCKCRAFLLYLDSASKGLSGALKIVGLNVQSVSYMGFGLGLIALRVKSCTETESRRRHVAILLCVYESG